MIIIAVALTVSVTMVIAMRQFNYKMSKVSQRQAMFDYINEVDKEVRNNYIGEISEGQLRASIANGYIKGIGDGYAAYLTAAEYRAETERLSGKWTGLGLEVAQFEDGSVVISAVHKNSSADKAGIQKGDILTYVDGNKVTATDFSAISYKLKNAQKVKLTVNRKDSPIAFEISASSYTLTSVESRLIGTTGYIRISAFYQNTPEQFSKAFAALEAKQAENYIFDLRYNSGGDLEAAGKVIGYLIPRGTYAKCVFPKSTTNLESAGTYEINKPTVTLVNGGTEGEAELFASVLQELKKTKVVGTPTAGRATVQRFYPIKADGAAIKISVASVVLASGESFEGKGVVPDAEAALPREMINRFAFLNEQNDPQMIAALSVLLKGGLTDTTTTGSDTGTTTQGTSAAAE